MSEAQNLAAGKGLRRLHTLGVFLGLTVLYYLAARLGLKLAFAETNASPIWPPTGLAIAVMYGLGYRYWPAIAVGAFAANFAVFSANHVAASVATALVSTAIAGGNTLEALAAAWLLRRSISDGDPFARTSDVFIFVIVAGLACLISAAVGVESLIVGGLAPSTARADIALNWWLGDLGGAVVLMPALFSWSRGPLKRLRFLDLAEIAIALTALLLLLAAVFANGLSERDGTARPERLLLALFFPLQAWAAYRHGTRGVTLSSLLLAFAAVLGTLHHDGPFSAGPLNDSLILLISFVLLASMSGLLMAADLRERNRRRDGRAEWRALLPSWPLLLFALCLTVLSWHWMSLETERRARDAFQSRASELKSALTDRIQDYVNLLRGAAGLIAGSHAMNHERWARYVANLQLHDNLPGLLGVGYAPVLRREERDALTARMRDDGFPAYQIWPTVSGELIAPVIYIEPFSGRNLRAFGFDMYTQQTQRSAMDRARDAGRATMSGTVELVQEDGHDAHAGALLYLPVFRGDIEALNPDARRERLLGFVFAAFRARDLIDNTLGNQLRPYWLSIYDGDTTLASKAFYNSQDGPAVGGSTLQMTADVGNHLWTLRFRTTPEFETAVDRQKAQLVLIAGSVISLLLFTLVRFLSLAREGALRIAEARAIALRDSEAATAALAESAQDAIIIADERACIVAWNPGASRIFGYTAQQAVGMNLWSLLQPEFHAPLTEILGLMSRSEQPQEMRRTLDVEGRTVAGQRIPLEMSLSSWRTSSGRLYGGIARDISERERNIAFLRGMFNDAPDAIIVVDESGTIRHANARCASMFGYNLGTLIGANLSQLLVPAPRSDRHARNMAEYFAAPVRRKMGSGLDLKCRRSDGQEFPVDIALTPLVLKDGILTVATISDVTELRRNQEALRSSEERLRLLVDGVSEYAIFMLDPDGNVASWNIGAERIKGYRAEEIIGQHFSSFYTADDRARAHPQEVLTLARERGHYEEEGWRVRKDGSRFWASISVTALREGNGNLHGFSKVARDMTDRRAAEEAIAGISRRLAIATDAAGIGVWEWTPQQDLLTWDEQMYAMYDIDRSEADDNYSMWRQRLLIEDVAPVEQALQATVETGCPFSAEFRIRARDGSVRHIKAKAVAIADEFGQTTKITGVNWDITELRTAELALRASEERFRSTLENAPIGMGIASIDGRWLDVNRALCEFLGYEKAELLQRFLLDFTHAQDRDVDRAQTAFLLEDRWRSFQLEKRYIRKDGQLAWGRLTASVVRDADNQPRYFIRQIEDITLQHRDRENLKATLALQSAILDSADVCIIAGRPDGVITLFNRAAERMLGYDASEMIGRQTPAVFHDEQEVTARAAVLSRELGIAVEPGFETFVAKARTSVADLNQWTYIRKDGSRFPVNLSVTAIRDEYRQISGFLGIASDITERARHDQLIRQALHEKETLLKEVYHRVKNNLQVITSLFNLQARTLPAGTAQDALKEGAERVRAMALVHEKLYQSSTLASISIADYVTALCRDLSSASGAAERGVRFNTAIEAIEIGLETAVPLGLFMNELISNCLKHGFPDGRGGEVRIGVKRLDATTGLLEIADNGIGYPETALNGQSKSLGLKLIGTLSRQLDGQLRLENRDGAYAELRFRLVEPEQAKK